MSANDILFQYDPTGASQLTAWTQSRTLKEKKIVGVAASHTLAKEDLPQLKKYLEKFLAAARTHKLPPALLAAIASRESRAGAALDTDGWGRYDRNGFGLMQVDRKSSPTGGPFSSEHVNQAAALLRKTIDEVTKNHKKWPAVQQLRGGVAGYNFGADDVWTIPGMDKATTGDDYSNDVWARAQFLAPTFGGISASKADGVVTAPPPEKKEPGLPSPKGSAVVRDVQLLLIKYGYMTVDDVKTGPGILGPRTKAALERFVADRSQPAPESQTPKPSTPTTPTTPTTPVAGSSSAALADGISVDTNHAILKKMATEKLETGKTSSCVRTTLDNMTRMGIKDLPVATAGDGNHSRGAMAQLLLNGQWESLQLAGSSLRTIKSTYGTVKAYVIVASAYKKMALAGQIPNGAIIFQTKHGWDYGAGPYGNDMGIVRDNGRTTFNYKKMPPIIYGDKAKEVVLLLPKGAIVRSEPSKRKAS